jgi:hypothetical protein
MGAVSSSVLPAEKTGREQLAGQYIKVELLVYISISFDYPGFMSSSSFMHMSSQLSPSQN